MSKLVSLISLVGGVSRGGASTASRVRASESASTASRGRNTQTYLASGACPSWKAIKLSNEFVFWTACECDVRARK